MIPQCAFKTLLFSVILFFYQQGLANDTYGLEEFRKYQMKNWKPLSKEQQSCIVQPVMSPLENICIGFVRLNIESGDVSGDGRLEICENYEVTEKDFKLLINFYFNYVNSTDTQNNRKMRIQRVLRLMHHIFAININQTNGASPDKKELISVLAQSLFDHFFSPEMRNGGRNPYFNYFSLYPVASQFDYLGFNNILVLMLVTFLGPHFLFSNDFHNYFTVLRNSYTEKNYDRALSRGSLYENINENSPQSIASHFTAIGLDTETALLIGLTAMASAAFQSLNSGQEWPETLETLLQRYLPCEILGTLYWNLVGLFPAGRSWPVPQVMFTVEGMQEFTQGILGIDVTPESASSQAESSESPGCQSDYSQGSDNQVVDPDGEPHSEHQDQLIVIQQQNELITELPQESAGQPATGETGAVGGASAGTKKCPLCADPLTDIIVLHCCPDADFCNTCADRLIYEQRECPFCRNIPLSYMKIPDMSLP
ncbi:RING finger protein [Endozoicomonas sp. 8E]|uniref:RING finger protein n=1 Tax=Endozoicomonas sp. 8E TaxID=3035692 RepID=UPI0029392871|nr:RING finger protein [Endozoicomonas sp. 8E]WOG29214.1 RING finger protein [Endozoicomonas sp. 8E]